MRSYFNRTKSWNSRMGVKTPTQFIFPVEDELQLMSSLATEEAMEMYEAKSKEDVLDALADQQFVLYGNIARYGISWDEFRDYLHKVIVSNESKFADTLDQAEESIKKEADRLGIDEKSITFTEVDGKYVISNLNTGKILKSVNYIEPYNI